MNGQPLLQCRSATSALIGEWSAVIAVPIGEWSAVIAVLTALMPAVIAELDW